MSDIICPKCKQSFDASDKKHYTTSKAAAAAGAISGAWIGSSIGIATAGVGIAATIPLAAAGGILAFLCADKFRKCPHCGKIFQLG